MDWENGIVLILMLMLVLILCGIIKTMEDHSIDNIDQYKECLASGAEEQYCYKLITE